MVSGETGLELAAGVAESLIRPYAYPTYCVGAFICYNCVTLDYAILACSALGLMVDCLKKPNTARPQGPACFGFCHVHFTSISAGPARIFRPVRCSHRDSVSDPNLCVIPCNPRDCHATGQTTPHHTAESQVQPARKICSEPNPTARTLLN